MASQPPVMTSFIADWSFERREDRRVVGGCRRQPVEQLLRHLAGIDHRLEADRVAVALEPLELALVGIEVFHPELGGVGMRREGADPLDVDARDHAVAGHHHLERRVAVQRVAAGQRVVVPPDHDRRGALGDGAGLADRRDEVAHLVELGEEVEPLLAGVAAGFAAGGETGGVDAEDRLVGRARVAGEGHRVGIFWLQQILPAAGHRVDDVLVHREAEHAVVVTVPATVGVLHVVRNVVPGGDLVGLHQPLLLGGRPEGEAHVDHVGRLRTLVVLVGADRLELVGGAGVGIELVDLDAVLGLEPLDHAAVAAPVVRQGDGCHRPLRLGSGDQRLEILGPGRQRRGGGERKAAGDRGGCHSQHKIFPLFVRAGRAWYDARMLAGNSDNPTTKAPLRPQTAPGSAGCYFAVSANSYSMSWTRSGPMTARRTKLSKRRLSAAT